MMWANGLLQQKLWICLGYTWCVLKMRNEASGVPGVSVEMFCPSYYCRPNLDCLIHSELFQHRKFISRNTVIVCFYGASSNKLMAWHLPDFLNETKLK